MRITFRNSRYEAIASYQEKDALKSAGFRWDAKARCWFTALPANMLQAEDRIHRIGQQGNALIQQLVFDGSLDAKMADTLVRKMEVIERALDRVTEDEPIDIFETEYA